MLKYQDKIYEIQKIPEQIRNISVIAHVDHGKTTLTDSFLAKAGLMNEKKAGEVRTMDSMKDEVEKGITIKSSSVSLYFELEKFVSTTKPKEEQREEEKLQQKVPYLINLIDSPGHVDFSSEVTAALRVTDGALVVVDAVEGVCVQTETVLRQACMEKVKPVLFINKIDRLIIELGMNGEQIYQQLIPIIDRVNEILSIYLADEDQQQTEQSEWLVDPLKGTVAFGAGRDCWAFTLETFAQIYSQKFNCQVQSMQKRLWGDNFYDATQKKWKCEATESGKQDSPKLKRGFDQFVMGPIISIYKTIKQGNQPEQLQKILGTLGITLSESEKKLTGNQILKTLMSKWLNAADNLLHMIIQHLPSPKEAMKYRADVLLEGGQDNELYKQLQASDPKGPLIMYISKMVPSADYQKLYAFGRVFSGTIKAGEKVKVLTPNFIHGESHDIYEKQLSTPVIMMARNTTTVQEVPCGNTCALMGIDSYLTKTGTITTVLDPYPLRSMKFSVSPVMRVAIEVENQKDLPQLLKGLQTLQKIDPLVQFQKEENSGQYIISGTGQLNIEICLNLLRDDLCKCNFKVSQPIVNYKECVSDQSKEVCMTKSNNKLNRLFGKMLPLGDDLVESMEKGHIRATMEQKQLQNSLISDFDWDKDEVKKIWGFGPEETGCNIIVDACKQVQGLKEIKDSIMNAFQDVCNEGVLIGENLRGCRFNITDALVHTDPAHRGADQIFQMARRLFYGAIITAKPRILEPIYLCEITVPNSSKSGIYNMFHELRATMLEEQFLERSQLCLIKLYLPVAQSFGFSEKLRQATHGQAFPQLIFHHWQYVEGDPFEKGTQAYDVVQEIRKRKKMKSELPTINDYLDKL